MNPMPRRLLLPGAALFAVLAALVLTGCAGTDGLGHGDSAPSVSVQPRPEAVWPAWAGRTSRAPGAEASTRQPPPRPLRGVEVGSGGLASMDVHAILRADPRTRPLADRGMIDRPGRAGIRPPMFLDLTGDKKPDMLVAADTESGRSILVVYTERGGKIYPILFTSGRSVSVETVGPDLLVRTPCSEGGEQAVRFHWDGARMSTVSDIKNYKRSPRPSSDGVSSGSPSDSPSDSSSDSPSGSPSPWGP
ncbi:hypothetical protein [Streptomyces sp. Je 1-369]|uniref:hypothetical protein n=1 Tax=Streptomyces sp. Je 1-369 TaxID=2966192 RepID=UPI002286B90D|nr:hypothetical protein [Streptomyces sp. Je 1-369]WAL95360.1 hypothetical protein NOO62_13190 [Streptomyces sp. Je 1-369]